jgi:hypothetical protein
VNYGYKGKMKEEEETFGFRYPGIKRSKKWWSRR